MALSMLKVFGYEVQNVVHRGRFATACVFKDNVSSRKTYPCFDDSVGSKAMDLAAFYAENITRQVKRVNLAAVV